MKTKCLICGELLQETTRQYKRKTCSPSCAKKLQVKTLGRSAHFIHGFARAGKVERLHGVWRTILDRCTNNKSTSYPRYGGRGITVCEEWKEYLNFRKWAVESGHKDGLSVERVDNEKGYSPDNCVLADRKTQARNRSSSRLILFNGKNTTVAELAESMGVKYSYLYYRLSKSGWVWHDKIL